MNQLKKWLKAATKQEHEDLIRLAGTTYSYINQLANESRKASPEMAGRIAYAAAQIAWSGGRESFNRLPKLERGDLNDTCNKCPYYKGCNNDGE